MTDVFATALSTLRTCICTALSEAGRPVCSCCASMSMADQCCSCSDSDSNGVATLRPVAIGPSRSFPTILPADPDFKRCGPNYLVLQLSVEIQRCTPVPSDTGGLPDCTTLTTAALDWLEDAAVIRQAVGCCLATLNTPNGAPPVISRYSIGVTAPIDPLGGCGGSALTVWLGVPHCACPD